MSSNTDTADPDVGGREALYRMAERAEDDAKAELYRYLAESVSKEAR